MQEKESNYIAILAGGGGTRLWPKSRKALPKQFLPLFDHKTLLQITFDRVKDLVLAKNILVITSEGLESLVKQQLPTLSEENILVEPLAAGTAAAAGLAALHVHSLNKDAVVSIVASDHYISEKNKFTKDLLLSQEVARKGDYLVTLGLVPTSAHTGLGYINAGEEKFDLKGRKVFWVEGFTEKPDEKTASIYIKSDRYFWNANINTYQVKALLEAFRTHMPTLYGALKAVERLIGKKEEKEKVKEIWKKLKPEPIDTGVFEKAKNVLVIPADFSWLDIGDWGVLYELLAQSEEDNVVIGGEKEKVIHLGTKKTLVYPGHRLVAMVGLEDLVVIDTPDVLLVCDKKNVQNVKNLVQGLKEKSQEHYL